MKFTIETADLTAAMADIVRVVPTRSTIPILNSVKLTASAGGDITFEGTDMAMALVRSEAGIVAAEGAACVDAALLRDIASHTAKGSQIECSLEDGRLMVRSGRASFALGALEADTFPVFNPPAWDGTVEIPAAVLDRLLAKTSFAMSTETTRYYLCGICLVVRDGFMVAVATDGHLLGRCRAPAPDGLADLACFAEDSNPIILPRDAIAPIRALADGADQVTTSLSATAARFEVGRRVLTTKLIDGTFPDYERVIPAADGATLSLPREAARATIQRVAVVAETSAAGARSIRLTMGGNAVTFSTQAEGREGQDFLDAAWTGNDLTIGFNFRFLLTVLGQCEGDTVEMNLHDAAGPARIDDGDDFLAVIMPMRV